MSRSIWPVLFCLASLLVFSANITFALTPEEVLKLKKAGVSEETIQMMLEQEHERQVPPNMIEQDYATDRPGTWKLKDGRTITSTGKRQLPLHYPTDYPPPAPYSPDISPYILTPPLSGWRLAPTPHPSPSDAMRPPSAPAH